MQLKIRFVAAVVVVYHESPAQYQEPLNPGAKFAEVKAV
jgi:hypothetical protein